MQAIRIYSTVEEDGSIHLEGIPCKKGDQLELIVLVNQPQKEPVTPQKLKDLGLVGMWEDREDIEDSLEYARQLRNQAQHRLGEDGC